MVLDCLKSSCDADKMKISSGVTYTVYILEGWTTSSAHAVYVKSSPRASLPKLFEDGPVTIIHSTSLFQHSRTKEKEMSQVLGDRYRRHKRSGRLGLDLVLKHG